MAEAALRKREVVTGTLKTVAKGTLKVADFGLKTVDTTLKAGARGMKDGEDGGQGGFTDYGEKRVQEAAAVIGRQVERTEKRALRRTARNLRQGTLNPAKTIKTGASGIKTAATEAKYASQALAAASRSPQATAMIRQAQKRLFRAGKELVAVVAKLARAVGKAVVDMLALLLSGAGIVLLVLLLVILGSAVFSSSDPDRTPTPASESAVVIYYTLRTEMGLNSAAACGVMANIYKESGFDLNALGDDGTSYGLCQWHDSRWDRLNDYCYRNDYSPGTLKGQLRYLEWELKTHYTDVWEYLQNVDDDVGGCCDAAAYYCIHFEKPRDSELKAAERGECALDFWWDYAAGDATEQGMKLALVAYNELGNEGGEKYWRWYWFRHRVEWCACFVSWCANECGYIGAELMPRYCACDDGMYWFQNRKQWTSAGPGVRPEPGWVAFYDIGHTGIVFATIGDTVYMVEGNAWDAVRLVTYPLETIRDSIFGYGVPAFAQ